MANHHYQHFHYSWSVLTIIGLLIIQESTFALARNSHSDLTNASNSPTTPTTTTVTLHDQDDEDLDDGMKGSQEDMYADEYEENNSADSMTPTSSQSNHNQSIVHDDDYQPLESEDERGSQQEEEIEDDPDNHIHGDTMSVTRFVSKRPTGDLNHKKSSELQSTSPMTSVTSNLWRDILTKPPILVGIIGAIVVGMLSAILLIMFIIYRMRKKDEGSYALEEGPRKSPSHAYTRVSSREFFA